MNRTAAALAAGAALLIAVPGASFAAGHAGLAGKNTQQAKPQAALLLGTLGTLTTAGAVINVSGGSPTPLSVGNYTRYIGHTQAAAIAGLRTGEQVAVRTLTSSAGTRAVSIEFDTAPFGLSSHIVGTITGGTVGSSLSITPASGTPVTVQLTGSTKYLVNGSKVNGLTSIPANQQAVVSFLRMTTGGTVATTVVIGQAPAKAQRVVVRGRVASFQGNVLSITVKRGTTPVQVQITTSTKFIVGGKLVTAVPALAQNQLIVILATRQSDGSLVADTVGLR
jgi:hypothetical protein